MRLENLIDGILHYSKIGKIMLEPVDLNLIIREEFKNYQKESNVICTIKGKLPTVTGDKIQLSQVVSNLISNAVKHSDKEICKISVSSIEKPDCYEITFEDNGPGISPKYHEKIFEVFQTLNEKDTYESTGIGLSIVKKIIEKHKGTIKVASKGKLGTKFIISYSKIFQP
jgi:signal transduction histidine kinase